MTIPSRFDPTVLKRLLALIGRALMLSDAQELHATGIALDTARLEVETALAEARRTNGSDHPPADEVRSIGEGRKGAILRKRG